MKLHSIDSLIKLHQKQAYILELMKGQTGQALDMLAEMYKKNFERIIYLTSDKATNHFSRS